MRTFHFSAHGKLFFAAVYQSQSLFANEVPGGLSGASRAAKPAGPIP
jgi:hypothetical protein